MTMVRRLNPVKAIISIGKNEWTQSRRTGTHEWTQKVQSSFAIPSVVTFCQYLIRRHDRKDDNRLTGKKMSIDVDQKLFSTSGKIQQKYSYNIHTYIHTYTW